MCGLAGILSKEYSSEQLSMRIGEMTKLLDHRGPDSTNIFVKDNIALGHTRLSIIDLTESGNQPMTDIDSGVSIVLNGEIYNFKTLKAELLSLGVSFKGTSDTEVLLRSYIYWGLEGLKKIEGIFSFAIWDQNSETLILARDRLGIKPLFFSYIDKTLFFSSEIKSILKNSEVNRDINPQSFSEYLWYGNSYEDRTIYKDIHALKPGHWLIHKNQSLSLVRWWSIEEFSEKEKFKGSLADAIHSVSESIDDSVSRQLVADVPVALFLSGGLDSSAIAASASRFGEISSFACGFDFEDGVKELPKAQAVAKYLGINHEEIHISDKVVLQGDGGDEIFGGYRRYKLLQNDSFWKFFPKWIGKNASHLGNVGTRVGRIINVMKKTDMAEKMALLSTIETQTASPFNYLTAERNLEISKSADPFLAYKSSAERFKEHDIVDQMLLTDLTLQLPSQFLTKVDRATMAQGIEARVPLLDEKLLSLSLSLPSKYKVSLMSDKKVLRQSVKNRLPKDIINQKKTGFGVPYQYWIKDSLYDLIRSTILDKNFCYDHGFDRPKLEMALSIHSKNEADLGFTLWKVFQFALWAKTN
jgi:asparagine synthase (glutamine-hydrolysing)